MTDTKSITANNLLDAGKARRWTKNGKDRAYITTDAILAAMNVKISYYGTGNVNYAEMDGEKISNSEAKRLLSGIRAAAPHIDITTDSYERRDGEGYGAQIDAAVNAILAEVNHA